MERHIAEALMQEVLKLTAQLNVIIHKVKDVTPEADRLSLDRHMGPIMAACDEHLFRPILRHYPDLDPNR
jgi:hypothetical protein